ncbi:peptidylprolyl isomerase, partial [bacterium]|nr:peptidylprolyl isomerase [bacterium]
MNGRTALAALALAQALLCARGARAEAGDEAAVSSAVPKDAWALVDGSPITKEAVSRRAKLMGLPSAHVLDWLVVEKITAARLEKDGFPLSSITKDELDTLRKALEGQGLPPNSEAELEASLRVNVAFRKRVEKEATPEALAGWFEKHKLGLAGEVRARHILFSTRDGEAAALARAKKVLAVVAADGSNMASLAREQSDDPTAPLDGGDLDWFARSPILGHPLVHVYEPVVRACFELGKPGLIASPVQAR